MSVQQVEPLFASTKESRPEQAEHSYNLARLATWGAFVVAALVSLGRLLIEYGEQLWNAEHYRFFPMLLLAAGWLAWRRSRENPMAIPESGSLRYRAALWAAALLVTASGLFAQSPFLAAVAILVIMLAGLYEWGGRTTLQRFLPVWAVLLLALRLPFNWDQRLIVAMQRAATYWASGTLDILGIRHLADGVVIRLPAGDFFIDEACSGVHSLFATVAFVAVFAVASQKGFVRFLFLMIAAVLWVLVANAARVLSVVVLSTRYNLPVVDGIGHEVLGIVIFATVIALVLSTDRLLLFLFPPKEWFPTSIASTPNTKVGTPRRSSRMPIILTGSLVVIAGTFQLLPSRSNQLLANPAVSGAGLSPIPEDALPATWNGWSKVEFQIRERDKDDPAGELSRIWYYRKGRVIAAVSIDGPFDAWHDTEVCYVGLGYTTQSREDHPAPEGGPSPGGFTELSITGGAGRHGHVLFMAYSQDGGALRPPASRNASFARLVSIWKERVSGKNPLETVDGPIYQVQVFSESGLHFTSAEQEELRQLFHAMRKEIAELTAKQAGSLRPEVAQQVAENLDP